MNDCSSFQGSTSSSEATSLRGSSGVGGGNGSNSSAWHGNNNGGGSNNSSSSGSGRTPRIRIVRLCRPNSTSRRTLISTQQNTSFGFAIRGGREFSIGFFVSRIEKGSEADLRGLRVGDQIIRVNGYLVDDAVHRELSQYMSCQDRLTLKVRGVGMVPIKERSTDPLTWHIVPLRMLAAIQKLEEFTCQDVRITLNVEPCTKLGLGICKGPEWKPGIFVQFTKEVGIARDAGLRPGDQLLSCNDIDFGDILFSEAVTVMKSSHCLELIVRTAAGIDLFPGESSGYNSSASSVTGDQSPCWGDQASKRLSIVREEDGTEKIGQMRPKIWERKDLDRRKERLHMVEPPIVPESYRTVAQSPALSETSRPTTNVFNLHNTADNNTTIIKLSETGTVINNTMVPMLNHNNNMIQESKRSTTVHVENGGTGGANNVTIKENSHTSNTSKNNIRVNISNAESVGQHSEPSSGSGDIDGSGGTKMADICFVSRKIETKTVTVEVHRGATEEMIAAPPPPPPMSFSNDPHSSLSSSLSIPSSCDGSSLCSAISDELKKRAERGKYVINDSDYSNHSAVVDEKPKFMLKKVRSAICGGANNDKHNALIDEFKMAHKRMFKNGFAESPAKEKLDEERQYELRGAAERDETDRASKEQCIHPISAKTIYAQLERPNHKPPPPAHPPTPSPDYDDHAISVPTVASHAFNGSNPPPHPPPPPAQQSTAKQLNGTNNMKGTMGRCAAHEIAKASGDAAELESIDSFKLTNPSSPTPKPPSMYFNLQSTGPATLKKPLRPVSVTIGEYTGRKEPPSKFDFIKPDEQQPTMDDAIDATNIIGDVSGRLKSELEQTLSRSNLKARNDIETVAANGTTKIHINQHQLAVKQPPPPPPGYHNNSNTTNNNNNNGITSNGKASLHKTQSNVEKITAMLVSQNLMGSNAQQQPSPSVPGGRVTVNFANGNKTQLRKTESTPINGILKNGNASNGHHQHGGPTEPKNISFGNITTVVTTEKR